MASRRSPGTISGIVQTRDERPVADARVSIVQAPVDVVDTAALTGADGAFVLTAPADGDYGIGCVADGFQPATVTATVSSGQSVAITIVLDR